MLLVTHLSLGSFYFKFSNKCIQIFKFRIALQYVYLHRQYSAYTISRQPESATRFHVLACNLLFTASESSYPKIGVHLVSPCNFFNRGEACPKCNNSNFFLHALHFHGNEWKLILENGSNSCQKGCQILWREDNVFRIFKVSTL